MSLIFLFLPLTTVPIKMKSRLKTTRKIVLTILSILFLNILYVFGQDSSYETDGRLDFNKPDAIASGLNKGEINVERLFNEGNSKQIESVFNKVNQNAQSRILSFFSSSNVEVNGKISSFKEGNIATEKTILNLNDYKSFDGTITISQDGSITITTNTNKPFKLDNAEITSQGGSKLEVTGNSNTRTINAISLQEGQGILLRNSEGEVKLFSGSISIVGNRFTLQENSAAGFMTARIATQNTKIDLGFNSGENSYALFDIKNKEGLLVGKDFSVEFFEDSIFEKIGVNGNNINVINGKLAFVFEKEKSYLKSDFGKGVKNMILTNLQTGHRVWVFGDGSFAGFKESSKERVGGFRRSIFLSHAYDAELIADVERIKNDYKALVGNLPSKPNEDTLFQNFVKDNAEKLELRLLIATPKSLGESNIKNLIEFDIPHSGSLFKQEEGELRFLDPDLESQRIAFKNYFGTLGQRYKTINSGSELSYSVENGIGEIRYYPNAKDRNIFEPLRLPNDRYLREVILPNWIITPHTENNRFIGNNVKEMPAELLKGFSK